MAASTVQFRFRHIAFLLGLVLAVDVAPCVAAETFEPVNFKVKPALALQGDLRLEPGREGTIEILLAINSPLVGTDWVPVAVHGDSASGINWQIDVNVDRKSVRFHTPDRRTGGVTAPCDFTDGRFHHVACVVREDEAWLVVDGKRGESVQDEGFAAPTWPGRPLTIGGIGAGPGFGGWVYSVRIWDAAFHESVLAWTRKFYGLPVWDTGHAKMAKYLVGYSQFTIDEAKFVYTQPKILTTPLVGGSGGSRFFIPVGSRRFLQDIQVTTAEGTISGLQAEIRSLDSQYPEFLPRAAANPMSDRLREVRRQLMAMRDGEIPQDGEQQKAMTEEMVKLDDLPAGGEGATFGLGEPRTINRIYGTQFRGMISDLGIEVNQDGQYHALTKLNTRIPREPFMLAIPGEAEFAGLIGRIDHGGRLISIGLAYRFAEARPNQALIDALRLGRWIDRDAGDQVRDEKKLYEFRMSLAKDRQERRTRGYKALYAQIMQEINDMRTGKIRGSKPLAELESGMALENAALERDVPKRLVGNFTGALVYRFNYRRGANPEDDRLDLLIDDYCVDGNDRPVPGADQGAFSNMPRLLRFRWLQGNAWEWVPDPALFNAEEVTAKYGPRLLSISDRGVRISGGTEMYPERFVEQNLIPVTAYEKGNRADKVSWGGTFSLEQKPMLTRANFRGYNPVKMNHRDYQYSGTTKFIFKFPVEDSRDYYFAEGKMIVPYGVHYRSCNQGREGSNTKTLTTSQEYQSEWSASLGVSAESPFVGSFSADTSFGQQAEQMNSEKTVCTLTSTKETKYALILDRGRAELDPEFRSRIEELRDKAIAWGDDDFDRFFDVYGTHYAHAITYGGMAWLEMHCSESEYNTMHGQSASVHVSGGASLEGLCDIGVSGGLDAKQSQTLHNMVGTQRAKFGTYGGSLSAGEGWSLNRGEEVPLLLDLRPIYEVLAPTHFDDPYVWVTLRAKMRQAFFRYTGARVSPHSKTDAPAWASKFRK